MSVGSSQPVEIAIIAEAPEPGLAKARFALSLGVAGAAELQARLIRRTLDAAMGAGAGPVTIWAIPHERHAFFQELQRSAPVALRTAPPGDERTRASKLLEGSGGPAIVIGVDALPLSAEMLRDAAEALRSGSEVVFCPTDDHRFGLIGARAAQPAVFAEDLWASDDLVTEARRQLARMGITWREPGQLWEVRRPSDLRRMQREGFSDLLAGIAPERRPVTDTSTVGQ